MKNRSPYTHHSSTSSRNSHRHSNICGFGDAVLHHPFRHSKTAVVFKVHPKAGALFHNCNHSAGGGSAWRPSSGRHNFSGLCRQSRLLEGDEDLEGSGQNCWDLWISYFKCRKVLKMLRYVWIVRSYGLSLGTWLNNLEARNQRLS